MDVKRACLRTMIVFALLIMSGCTACVENGDESVFVDRLPSPSQVALPGSFFVEHEGEVYFSNLYELCKKSPDGEIVVVNRDLPNGFLLYHDGFIYSCSQFRGVYRMDLKGSNVRCVNKTGGDFPVIVEDALYFQTLSYSRNKGYHGEISRMNLSDGRVEVICEDGGMNLIHYEGKLYYYSAGEGAVIELGLDGTDRRIIAEADVFKPFFEEGEIGGFAFPYRISFAVVDDMIYYLNSGEIHTVSINGGEPVSLGIAASAFTFAQHAVVAYQDDGATILIADRNGDGQVVLTDNGWLPFHCGEYAYFYDPSSGGDIIYRIDSRGDIERYA